MSYSLNENVAMGSEDEQATDSELENYSRA